MIGGIYSGFGWVNRWSPEDLGHVRACKAFSILCRAYADVAVAAAFAAAAAAAATAAAATSSDAASVAIMRSQCRQQ